MKTKFKRMYCLQNHFLRKNTNFSSFVFTGKNWDYYFATKISKNCELIENVELTKDYNNEKFIDKDYDNLNGLYLQYV